MKKINFGAIAIKDIEGNEQNFDIRKDLGNLLYMRGNSLPECELGTAIYHSEGDIELNDEQVGIVTAWIGQYPYLIREAVNGKLS